MADGYDYVDRDGTASVTTYAVLYTAPADRPKLIGELRAVNKGTAAKKIRVYISSSDTPGTSGCAIYDFPIPAPPGAPVIDLVGVELKAGKRLIVSSESTDVNFLLTVTDVKQSS